MRTITAWVSIYAFILVTAHAWLEDAHKTIASLAFDLLESDQRSRIQTLLPRGELLATWMVKGSSWADERGRENGKNHFIHISSCDNKHAMGLRCGSGSGVCITEALVRHIQTAMSARPGDSLRDALKYIIHYMGDLHQPLHVALESDFGGTSIKGIRPFTTGRDHDVSLHELWDNDLFQVAKRKGMFKEDFPKYNTTTMDFTVDDLKSESSIRTFVENIAIQTATQVTCGMAYWSDPSRKDAFVSRGDYLGDTYTGPAKEWTVVQVARAGIRLASLLSSIAEYRSTHAPTAGGAGVRLTR